MTLKEAIAQLVRSYNANEVFNSDTNSPKLEISISSIKALFSQYACVDFAYVVNALKGWDVYHIEFFQDAEQDHAPYHVVTKPKGKDVYFDVNGFFTLDELNAQFNGHREHTEVTPILASRFMIGGGKDLAALSKIARCLLSKHRASQPRAYIS